ncbi:hypothetical protein R3W88_032793 [Solanum pinnatisectum]|uniref:RING-type E3 ubiquitin transferase n=1 Tax=Solanum pinnatisectum TaxID=50273 RepID=A0AAV9LQ88_9SOLN|nr:hypothetical protein R3W88_032793 [Solanum pinnatisectum]
MQVPCSCSRTLSPDARLQHLPPVDYSFMSHIKLEHSNLGDEIEEDAEELSDEEIRRARGRGRGNHNIGTLQCGHQFHAQCINKWLQRKISCPFCTASVLPTNT